MVQHESGSLEKMVPLHRKAILAGLALLYLGQEAPPAPEVKIPEPIAVVIEEEEEVPDRRIRVIEEGMAYALRQIGRVTQEQADLMVKVILQEIPQYPGITELDVLGLIGAESAANPLAKSHTNARGLMQIMPNTGRFIAANLSEKWTGVQTLYEIERNLRYGIWYLNHLRERFPDNEQAVLAAYNWGPGYIQSRLTREIGLPRKYPAKVRRWQQRVHEEIYAYYEENYWRDAGTSRDPAPKPPSRSQPQVLLVNAG